MQKRFVVNFFALILLLWATACLLASVAAHVAFSRQAQLEKQTQVQEWGQFVGDLIEREITSRSKNADLEESQLVRSLIQNRRLQLAVFTTSGKYVAAQPRGMS